MDALVPMDGQLRKKFWCVVTFFPRQKVSKEVLPESKLAAQMIQFSCSCDFITVPKSSKR